MHDVTALSSHGQPKKRRRDYRWKGFQRENATFLYLDVGLTAVEVSDLLGIPLTSLRVHIQKRIAKPKHRPKSWHL